MKIQFDFLLVSYLYKEPEKCEKMYKTILNPIGIENCLWAQKVKSLREAAVT